MALVEHLFGSGWDLWTTDAGLRRVRQGLTQASHPHRSVPAAVRTQIAQTAANGCVQFRPMQSGYLCTVPLTRGACPRVALGRLSHQQAADLLPTLMGRPMTRASGRPVDNAPLQPMRSDRLEWLVRLPADAFPGPIEQSVQETAARILPALRRLLHARSVVLQESDEPASGGRRWRNVWADGDEVPEEVLNRLNERGASDSTDIGGTCMSVRSEKRPAGYSDGIPSVIQVPVNWPGRLPGRLLAVNREHRVGKVDVSGVGAGGASSGFEEFRDEDRYLLQAAASALETGCGIQNLHEDRQELLTGIVRSLVNVLDAKDSYTSGHSDRVAEYARLTAQHMGLSGEECEQICLAGLLHDIGKVAIPDDILNKPGRLNEQEARLVQRHPVTGYEILKPLNSLSRVLPGVLHHHESWDGSGYPDGLSGRAIPLQARILAVADAWDAMTSRRSYRAALPVSQARQILQDGAGRQWDPECVAAVLRCIDTKRIRLDASHRRLSRPEFIRQAATRSLLRWPGSHAVRLTDE